MILCGGDSFGGFCTPISFNGSEDLLGASAVEIISKKFNQPANTCYVPGGALDVCVANVLKYLDKNSGVKFLFFYVTSPDRIMAKKNSTTIDILGRLDYQTTSSKDVLIDQDNLGVVYNDLENPDNRSYCKLFPMYKKYYDFPAYLSVLLATCKSKKIKVLLISNFLDVSVLNVLTVFDNVQIFSGEGLLENIAGINLYGDNNDWLPSNHLSPESHNKIANEILSLHFRFIHEALLSR